MTPPRGGLPPASRLLRSADFERIYSRRQSAAAGPVVLYMAPHPVADAPVRLGLSVSRRIGCAVVRNRWKRCLREVFRGIRDDLPRGTDCIVVVRGGPPPRGAEAAASLADTLLTLARRIAGRGGAPPRDRRSRKGGP